jgi:hypothetical protein
MPSDEPLGARPGEHVSGVGALPGQASETGVAILPDEKVASGSGSLPTQENQSLLPGEVTAGIGALSVSKDESNIAGTFGSTSGLKGDSSVSDELSTPTALGGGALAIAKDEPSVTGTSGLTNDLKNESSLAGASSTTTGLAPPLPQTDLGLGASEGATDVASVPPLTVPPNLPCSHPPPLLFQKGPIALPVPPPSDTVTRGLTRIPDPLPYLPPQ